MARFRACALSSLALATLLGCGGGTRDSAYARGIADAERAETAGRFAEAAQGYDRAAREAPSTRERGHAEYLAAEATVRTQDAAGAAARLERIAYAGKATEHSSRALYDLAKLRIAHGDEAKGYADFERLAVTFPNDGLARPALRHVLAERDQKDGAAAASAWLEGIEHRVAGTELEESCAYLVATRKNERGELDGAHAAYLAIADRWPYPHGRTWDDSLYHAAEIDVARGRPEEAIEHLERMLEEREESSLMGTYERPKFAPAMILIAQIHRDKLHDRDKARADYHRLYNDFTTSPFRDDALWEEAKLWREDGDRDASCNRLDTLLGKFPHSRYVPCAIDACPSLKRPKESHAPAACPAYVTNGAATLDAPLGAP